MDLAVHKNIRRRLDDVDYWRKRAGWFDDDVSMKEFNSGVYDTYYEVDDDAHGHSSGGSSGGGGMSGFASSNGLGTFLKIGSAVLAVAFAILIFRALNRRSSSSSRKKDSKHHSSSDTKSRSHSRSRSSRSRSRSRRASSNYELMDEKSEARSKRSSRSRSRSRKHSKGRKSRSRSKSRREPKKEVLV